LSYTGLATYEYSNQSWFCQQHSPPA